MTFSISSVTSHLQTFTRQFRSLPTPMKVLVIVPIALAALALLVYCLVKFFQKKHEETVVAWHMDLDIKKLNGPLTYRDKNGDILTGNFINGFVFGPGLKIFNNGDLAKGIFAHSQLKDGFFQTAQGDLFEGRFYNKGESYGKLTTKNQLIISGRFKDHKLVDGKKSLKIDEDIFTRKVKIDEETELREMTIYKNDKLIKKASELNWPQLNGHEIYITKEGLVVDGLFKDGKMEGKGSVTYCPHLLKKSERVPAKEGMVIASKGKFADGILIEGKITYSKENWAEGTFKAGMLFKGIKVYHDKQEGQIEREGEFNDKGTLIKGKKTFLESTQELLSLEGDFNDNETLLSGTKVFLHPTYHRIELESKVFNHDGTIITESLHINNQSIPLESEIDLPKLNGSFIYLSNEGFIVDGKFKDGLLHGKDCKKTYLPQLGMKSDPNGPRILKTIVGEFSEGQLIKGVKVFSNGDKQSGKFDKNILVTGKEISKNHEGKVVITETSLDDLGNLSVNKTYKNEQNEKVTEYQEFDENGNFIHGKIYRKSNV